MNQPVREVNNLTLLKGFVLCMIVAGVLLYIVAFGR